MSHQTGTSRMRNGAAGAVGKSGAAPALAVAISLLFCAPLVLANSANVQPVAQEPDLSGVWAISPSNRSWDPNDPEGKNPDQLPMTPWGREELKAAKAPFGADQTFSNINDPVQKYCDPPGVTRLYTSPWQFSIVQSPARVDILFEYFRIWRTVTMNREHAKDLDPTWLGDSVGKYEGDTLVIDTVGLKAELGWTNWGIRKAMPRTSSSACAA